MKSRNLLMKIAKLEKLKRTKGEQRRRLREEETRESKESCRKKTLKLSRAKTRRMTRKLKVQEQSMNNLLEKITIELKESILTLKEGLKITYTVEMRLNLKI